MSRTRTEAKTNRVNARAEERAAYWAQKRPNWLNEPVARVVKPLQFLADATREVVQNAKGDWVARNTPVFAEAVEHARAGNGDGVQALALRVLAHGK